MEKSFFKNKLVPYLVSIAIAVSVGAISALISRDATDIYGTIALPPFAPPRFIFPIVWTTLLILLGIAAYRVFQADGKLRGRALIVYAVNLGIIFLWPIIFFNLQAFFIAFLLALLLLIAAVYQSYLFFKNDTAAGWLSVPYTLWTAFAVILSFAVYRLN